MNDKTTCPACENECDSSELVSGVCVRCKKTFASAHKATAVLPKWTSADLQIPKSSMQIECNFSPDEAFDVPIENDNADNGRALEIARRFKIGLSVCMGYRGDLHLALHCFAAAMDFRDITGLETDADIAKRFNVSKYTATKCKLLFQQHMGIQPLANQRSIEGRENMSRARKKQLTKGK